MNKKEDQVAEEIHKELKRSASALDTAHCGFLLTSTFILSYCHCHHLVARGKSQFNTQKHHTNKK